MLTPSDIRNKVFEKTKNGYRAEEVQPFLAEIASLLEFMVNENADLQRKLEILADKLEQYREDEESLRSALIGAQKLGDSVVRDSKRKAEAIIAQATRKSEELVSDAQASISREAMALNKMQVEVAKFKTHILALYKKHIELIQEIPYDEADVQGLQDSDMFMTDIDDAVRTTAQGGEGLPGQVMPDNDGMGLVFEFSDTPPEDDMLTYSEGGEDSEAASHENSRKKPSRFGTLRFGEDYTLTRRGE